MIERIINKSWYFVICFPLEADKLEGMTDCIISDSCYTARLMRNGAIQVLRNTDGGGWVSNFLGKSVTKA